MLRVGLTGDLGSGKSTVARFLAGCGAIVLSSDEMARATMEPGQAVYRQIVDRFGAGVVDSSGRLERAELARLAFHPQQPRVEELNRIVHPAVLAEQERQMGRIANEFPEAIVVVESALIFSATMTATQGELSSSGNAEPWRKRFDCIVVVTAARALKVARFVDRAGEGRTLSVAERERIEADATRRLDTQAQTAVPQDTSVLKLPNDGNLSQLGTRVKNVWTELQSRARRANRLNT